MHRYPEPLGITLALLLPLSCTAPAAYREDAKLPGDTLVEQLSQVSQLDELDDTDADYARCSAAATLSAYMLLGGDFAAAAEEFGVGTELTFENVHRLQEALYDHAQRDGRPGIIGSADARYDADGNLTGWDLDPGDEYHHVLEALALKMDRAYAPTQDDLRDKRAAVTAWLEADHDVVFIVGVDEDMERQRFAPMDERGNHYVAIFRRGGRFLALDSFRTPGRSALVELTDREVEDNLLYTPNALFVVYR